MLPVLAAVASLALLQDTDTTFAVRQGQRLDINDFGGSIVVKAWQKSAVRVRATHSSRDHIEIDAGGTTVTVKASGRHSPAMVDYEILVPAWLPLTLSGVSTDITIEGTQAELNAETVEGSIVVVGGSGNITLHSVEGEVSLESAEGHIEVNSVEGGITLKHCTGDISAETVDGEILLEGIQSADVDVGTVDGGITYNGALKDGGRYRFQTHDGDLKIAVPEHTNATVTVATFSGDFDPSFPVNLTSKTKHRFSFTLGTGSAHVELESFGGTITLRRPSEMADEKEE